MNLKFPVIFHNRYDLSYKALVNRHMWRGHESNRWVSGYIDHIFLNEEYDEVHYTVAETPNDYIKIGPGRWIRNVEIDEYIIGGDIN